MKLLILGSGTSNGVPVVGCGCAVCRSRESKDKRMRASLLVEGSGGERAVIDTGPEFRLQALRAGITRLDAVFLTHAHADHLHGLDDLRPLCAGDSEGIPVYGNVHTIAELRERFAYIFRTTQRGGGKPHIKPLAVDAPVRLGGLIFTPVPVRHGVLDILGWRIEEPEETKTEEDAAVNTKGAVYLTDTSSIPAASFRGMGKPRVLIIDGLRVRPHETHFNYEQALDAAAAIGAGRTWLTHLCHEHSHRETEAYCRDFMARRGIQGVTMEPGWDGLEIVL